MVFEIFCVAGAVIKTSVVQKLTRSLIISLPQKAMKHSNAKMAKKLNVDKIFPLLLI